MGASLSAVVAKVRQEDWTELIERSAAGDRAAFARFFDLSSAYVGGLARRIVGDRETADEVVLEVFVQVWQQAGRYAPHRGSPLAWLLNLTRSRAIDRLRTRAARERRREEPFDEESADLGGGDPAEHALLAERRRAVRDAIARLSREERGVIELAYFGGRSHTEIAAELGLPLGTVKTRLRLALLRLERHLLPRGGALR